eukprot:TRINITY_DN7428_c0_g1_i3.p1 TRINITY_DN7428_c0_g1~~TRINITY_DN7428_c0_g1_i3.p1  ORF type:complete len:653 (+),score=176.67 TRINITY_DN7428_c0_g1_i3:101-2059(+)
MGRGRGGRGRGGGFRGKQKRDDRDGSERDPKKPRFDDEPVAFVGVSDSDVGISAHVRATKPFSCVLKKRYVDFIVHEIDQNNEIVELTDMSADNTSVSEPKAVEASDEAEGFRLLGEVFSTELVTQVKEFVSKKDEQNILDLGTIADKDARTKVHGIIKTHFPEFVSEVEDGKLTLLHCRNAKIKQRSNRSGPDFLSFVLYKENKETSEVFQILARMLKVRAKQFSFAGTKDKRGVTSQRATIGRVQAEKMAALNLFGFKVGNYKYVDKALKLGDLNGNKFQIVLRDVKGEQKEIEEGLKALKDSGFINYFGLQRFGTGAVPTYQVGIAVLQGNYEEVCNLILKPREGEFQEAKQAREEFAKTGDAGAALGNFPVSMNPERQLLHGMKRMGTKAHKDAFNALPKYTRSLYLHSYQSLVWNHVVTKRVQLNPTEPIVGDLVLVGAAPKGGKSETTDENEEADEEIEDLAATAQVKSLTEEDVQAKKYGIEQVVLPLPGHAVQYPQNLKEEYVAFMKKDNLDPDNMKQNNWETSLPGGYRKIIQKPGSMTWEFISHDEENAEFNATDLAKLEGTFKEPTKLTFGSGKFNALNVTFVLPPSSYATMCLRELTKMDSASLFQRNVAPKKENEATEMETEKVSEQAKTEEISPDLGK